MTAAKSGMCGKLHPHTSPLPRPRTTLKPASVRTRNSNFLAESAMTLGYGSISKIVRLPT